MFNPIRSFLAWAAANQYDPALPSSKQRLWVHRHGWAKMYAPSLFAFAYYLFFSFMLTAYPEALRQWTHVADLSGLVRREPELVAQLDLLWVHGEGWRVAFVQHAFGFALVMKWVALLWTPVFFVVGFFTNSFTKLKRGIIKQKIKFGIFYIPYVFTVIFILWIALDFGLNNKINSYKYYFSINRNLYFSCIFGFVFLYQILSILCVLYPCIKLSARYSHQIQPKA